MEKHEIITTYAPDTDITFILKETTKNINDINGEEIFISTEVIGFYYGSPNEELTELYKGKLKATY